MSKKKRYLPDADPGFHAWQANFLDYVVANAAALGVSPARVAELQAARTEWDAGFDESRVTSKAALAATRRKNDARTVYKRLIRSTVGAVQSHAGVTDAMRKAMRVTVRDREPTPLSPDYVRTLPSPQVLLDFSLRGGCVIHFGARPNNERRNAKPPDIHAGAVYVKRGGASAGGTQWELVALPTRSPYVHMLGNKEPVAVAYTACWVDRLNRFGPKCDPVEASITP
jgi:hypothetical protein